MKKLFVVLALVATFCACVKDTDEKININITNNRSNMIKVEFRAGSTVCSSAYVSANSTAIDEAFAGEYDVYVSDWNGSNGTDGPFSYYNHGLYYSNNEYLTIN